MKISVSDFIKFLIFVYISVSVNSCIKPEEEISWEVGEQPSMLVVDAVITNELKQQGVKLTLSNAYFTASAPPAVSGATVSVSDGDSIFAFTESVQEPGMYFSNDRFAGVPGTTYRLMVTLATPVNGQKEYSSSSAMPEGVDIDSVYCEIYALPKGIAEEDKERIDTTILVVFYFGREPEISGNYYFAKIYCNHQPLFSSIKNFPYADDSQRNGEYVNLMAVIKNVSANDSIQFHLYSTGKKYYQYLDAVSKIDLTGNINSPQGPPANAVGNVNGALGFFLVAYTSSGSSVAIDKR